MKTIVIANQKGGVGKSTTAHAIGAGLAIKGKKVLFVDMDAQGNLSYAARAEPVGYGTMGVLERPETAEAEIQKTERWDIIASSPSLSAADMRINQTGKEYRLKEALEPLADKYDYCIVDTPPALGILTVNALTAADAVVIPVQADIYSLQGVQQLYATIKSVKRYCNAGLNIMGIVITRFNNRAIIRREVAEAIGNLAKQLGTKVFDSRVRECAAIVEAQALRDNIYTAFPKSNAALDYSGLVEEIEKAV